MQKVLEESLTDAYPTQKGPLPPVVFREPDTGKLQPLPEVPGKGKEKVGEEQAAQVLLNLQTPKKKSSAQQYILQRHTPVPHESAGQETSSLYAKRGLSGSDTESMMKCLQPGLTHPDDITIAESLPLPTPVFVRDQNFELVGVEKFTGPQSTSTGEHMDEGFHASAYPEVHKNLKLKVDEQAESMASVTIQQDTSITPPMTSPVIDLVSRPHSPNVHWPLPTTTITTAATTTTTLPLPPHFNKGSRIRKLETMDWSNMIREETTKFIESHEIDRKIEESVKDVVSLSVKQAMRAPLRARFKDLPTSDMKEILLQRNALMMIGSSWETKKKGKQESPKPPPGSPPSPPPPPPPPSGASGASGTTGASDSAQAPPPPPPVSSTRQEDQSTGTAAPSSSKTAASAEYSAWTTTDSQTKPSITQIPDDLYMDEDTTADVQVLSSDDEVGRDHVPTVNLRQSWWKPLTEDRPSTPEPAWTIPSSDLSMPTHNWASALKSTYAQPQENSLLAQTGDMATFMDWFCKQRGISELTPKDLEGPAFEIVKVFHPDVIHLQFQMEECHKLLTDQVDDAIIRYNVSKPLPLGGEPGHVTIQPDFFFNKDLEYLRYGRKAGRPALSISKMKAACYPDVGLEQLVPDQFWIEEECKYDIAAMYGISHWWVQRQRFYIDRSFPSEGDPPSIWTAYADLKRVRIEVFQCMVQLMKKIVLRRADLKEYIIAERDFKHMYPSDFEDLYLLNLQGHLNHLSPEDKKILTTAVNLWTRNLVIRHRVEDFQLGIESYQTQLNLTKPRWEATGFEFKHDYTEIDSPRAVTFRDRYGVQMIMRFNEIHKFSDGTLQQIDEALDYRVKEFQINRTNPGMITRFWTKKDVDRSKDFMFAIQKRLKTRRIFRNLESFVGGRIREGDYRLLKRTE
ncbi:hypothetical protein Tco_0087984 [Tanacetum coccineum]